MVVAKKSFKVNKLDVNSEVLEVDDNFLALISVLERIEKLLRYK